MKLYPIHAMGIRAYCSDLIVDPNDLVTVYFLAVCGYQATVKGIMANLLENHGISIEIDGMEYYLTRSNLSYKVQVKKLPSGLAHGLLLPKLALQKHDENQPNNFYIFTEDPDERLTIFFRHLDEKTEIPIHPSWAEWLWKLFEGQDQWVLELKTLVGSYRGYSFEFNHKQLHDLVSEAIRTKVPEIIKCMEWKGGDGDGKHNLS